jgi:hypothetical protein
MTKTNKKGRIGSQRLLQVAVAQYPNLLHNALRKAGAIKESENVSWTSPLERDQFKEFRDQTALEKIGVTNSIKYPLNKFWPQRGPVWDATGITNFGSPILLEAKAHIPEAASPASGASPKSLEQIEKSLEAARKHYAPRSSSVWSGTFYQYANRLAHQYYLQQLNNVPSILIFLNFINATEMDGPSSELEWEGAIRLLHTVLGLPKNLKRHDIYHAYIDASLMKVEV